MTELSTAQLSSLAGAFAHLETYDYFIFDTSAGVSKNVIAFCMSASEVILVITPEPTSLTDAYALMKILSLNGFKQTAKVVVNQSKNPKISQVAFSKLKDTVRKFLGIDLTPLGTIPSDVRVVEAVSAQQPYINLYPNTQATKSLKAIADQLLEKGTSNGEVFALDTFWHRCVDIFKAPLKMPVKKIDISGEKATPAIQPPSGHKLEASPPAAGPGPEITSSEAMPGVPPLSPASPIPQDVNQQLLEKLIEKVSTVSEELSGIRKAIEKGAFTSYAPGSGGKRSETPPPIIPLDFEAFLAEQESESGNDTK